MRLRRRALDTEDEGCHDPFGFGCSPPPPPPPLVPSTYYSGLAPSPAPFSQPPAELPLCPPILSPSPAPVNRGRRDQGGTHGYGAPPPPGVGGADDHHRQHYVTYVLIAAGVIAFLSLILLGVSVAVRRRQVRRRRQALLAPAVPANGGGGGNDDPEGGGGGGGGGGGVVHHIWYIRTVGLDEAAINSIAVTQYRAGAGLLGAADCSVCLGEFQDGELVRLLPQCGHAFHVPCIDTWLRAHVNCPLCRSHVLDPAVTAASGGGRESSESSSDPPADPDANANAAADQVAAASDAAPDHEEEEEDGDGREVSTTEEGQQEQSTSTETPPPPPPPPPPRNVRRAASMDAAIVSTEADVAALDRLPEAAPEEEQQIGGRRKRGTGAKASGSGHRGNLSSADRPASGGVPRSFFSRHSRARSSVLPL